MGLCRIFFNFITTSKISRVKQVLISLISRLLKVFCVRSESATVKSPSVLHPKKLSRSCMSNITNLDKVDPFADAAKGDDGSGPVQDGLVHVRIQQRNGRKTLTTIQGLSAEYDLKAIVKACKKEFACNGVVIEHPEYGEVLQLQGDQRTKVCAWLSNPKIGLVRADQLKVHGF